MLITKVSLLQEIRPDGTPLATHWLLDERDKVRVNHIRSVAYTANGFVIAGTTGRNAYQIGRMKDGAYESLDDTFDKILLLVRPSSDNRRFVSIARSYEPQLYRMLVP